MSEQTQYERWQEKIETISGAIEVSQLEVNDWEVDFLHTIRDQVYAEVRPLSWKQIKKLNEIYERTG